MKGYTRLRKQVHSIAFLTSGQLMVWDKDGNQIPDLQLMFSDGQPNPHALKDIADHASKFYLCMFGEWTHEVDKGSFYKITNLRSF